MTDPTPPAPPTDAAPAATPGWSTVWPDTAGYYWFYGYLDPRRSERTSYPTLACGQVVYNGSWCFIVGDHWYYKDRIYNGDAGWVARDWQGHWLPMQPPALPGDEGGTP